MRKNRFSHNGMLSMSDLEKTKKRVLITGGSGFIGSNLAKTLITQGYQLRIFDNNFRGNVRRLSAISKSLEFIEGDICDLEKVKKSVEGIDIIYHLAFINGTKYFYEMPDEVLRVGVKGIINILDAVKQSGSVEKFIYASSSEVYNQPYRIPTPEDERLIIPDPKNPRFSYAGGKLISEIMTLHYLTNTDTQKIIFRPHNIYGPDMSFEHVLPMIIEKIIKASNNLQNNACTIEIEGSGEETRAFCYIDDAVDGIRLCAEKGEDGEIYHVGTDEEISIANFIKNIAEILNVDVTLKKGRLRKGGTTRRCPDISKLRELGYQPKTSLKEGLTKTVRWYCDYFINKK